MALIAESITIVCLGRACVLVTPGTRRALCPASQEFSLAPFGAVSALEKQRKLPQTESECNTDGLCDVAHCVAAA